MPKYRVELSDGRIFEVESDAPPSEQDVLGALGGEPSAEPQAPPQAASERTWTDTAVDSLPFVGGAVGGLLGNIPGAALGGAGGEAYRQLINRARGKGGPATPTDAASQIGTEGAIQGATEGAGQAVGFGLRTIGKGLYRAGALPILSMLGKYGNVADKGLEAGIPVTKGGLAQAGEHVAAAKGAKDAAVKAADARGSIRTSTILDNTMQKMGGDADHLRRAGLPDPMPGLSARSDRILKANGPGMAPSTAEGIKHTLDDQLGGAYIKLGKKEPLSAGEKMNMELSQQIGKSQEAVVPGYRDMNKRTMDAVGVQKMIDRRLKGNQGLENALTMAAGPAAIPARLLMLPGVASTAGIAAHRAGQYPQVPSNLLRSALMALMGGGAEDP